MGLRILTHKCQTLKTVPSTDLCFEPAGYEIILVEMSGFRTVSKAQDHSSLAFRERAKVRAGKKSLLIWSAFPLIWRGKISKGSPPWNGGNAVLVHAVGQGTAVFTGTHENL